VSVDSTCAARFTCNVEASEGQEKKSENPVTAVSIFRPNHLVSQVYYCLRKCFVCNKSWKKWREGADGFANLDPSFAAKTTALSG
jgi:hypothetical protein